MGTLGGHPGNKASTKQRAREPDYRTCTAATRRERKGPKARGPRIKWADEVYDRVPYGDARKRHEGGEGERGMGGRVASLDGLLPTTP
jgi:hypothetical protein